jgi:hypothetical protein
MPPQRRHSSFPQGAAIRQPTTCISHSVLHRSASHHSSSRRSHLSSSLVVASAPGSSPINSSPARRSMPHRGISHYLVIGVIMPPQRRHSSSLQWATIRQPTTCISHHSSSCRSHHHAAYSGVKLWLHHPRRQAPHRHVRSCPQDGGLVVP